MKLWLSFISRNSRAPSRNWKKVLEGPSKELADRARMHVKIAEQRMKPSQEQNPRTAENIISAASP